MQKKVWSRVEISIETKLCIYNCPISCLLYGAEIWELTAYQLQRLEAFHVGCLRRILRVPYVQHCINAFVRMECKSPCVFALIRHRRLAWLGRLARMNEETGSRFDWFMPLVLVSPTHMPDAVGINTSSSTFVLLRRFALAGEGEALLQDPEGYVDSKRTLNLNA